MKKLSFFILPELTGYTVMFMVLFGLSVGCRSKIKTETSTNDTNDPEQEVIADTTNAPINNAKGGKNSSAGNDTKSTTGGKKSPGSGSNATINPVTVSLTSSAPNHFNDSTLVVNARFSSAVTALTPSMVKVTNGTLTNISGSGTDYVLTVTPSGEGEVGVSVDLSSIGGAVGAPATVLTREVDTTAPTVLLTSSAANPVTGNFVVNVTFSEAVTGFLSTDLVVTNGSITGFSGSGKTYFFTVVPLAVGAVSVDLLASAADDEAGNPSLAAIGLQRTFNDGVLTAAIASTAGSLTKNSPIPITVTFGHSVTGLVAGDFGLTNGTVSNFTGSGKTYTLDVTPTVDGAVIIDLPAATVQDVVGNGNAHTALTVTYDGTKPTPTLSTLTTSPTSSTTISYSVSFDDIVTGFTLSDIAVTNGTASALAGSGSAYTFSVTPTADGVVSVQILASSVQDAAGNGSNASNTSNITSDTDGPAVLLTTSAAFVKASFTVTATIAEPVANFIIGDINVINGAASNFVGSGTTYTFDITPSGEGSVTVRVPAGVATDAAGNPNDLSNQLAVTFDTTSPTGGAIHLGVFGSRTAPLTWDAASDNYSASANLQYEVRLSKSNNLTSVSAAESNGSVGMAYAAATTATTISGLEPLQTYFIAVIARDQAGNKTLYAADSGTTTAIVPDTVDSNSGSGGSLARSSQRKTFFDTRHNRHWVFYYNGTAIEYAYSVDGSSWTSVGTIALATSDFSVAYKNFASNSYVFVAAEANTYDISLYRGVLGSASVTFDAPSTAYDGYASTDRYTLPAVAVTADTGYVAVAALHSGSSTGGMQKTVQYSHSTTAGDSVISGWTVAQDVGNKVTFLSDLILVSAVGDDMSVITNGTSIMTYTYDGANWNSATAGGAGGWFSYGAQALNGTVKAMAQSGGNYYFGGSFLAAGGNPKANRIVRFDGTSWHEMGEGLSGDVYAIAVWGTDIYVGGDFVDVGGNSGCNRIARWDGAAWNCLGTTPLNDRVSSLFVADGTLYVGGRFFSVGGDSNKSKIVTWNGTSWGALGSGANGDVKDITMDGDSNLYIGGSFISVGGISTCKYICKWNGATWADLGNGAITAEVNAVAYNSGILYVGGAFINADDNADADRLATYDVSSRTWAALVTGGIGATVHDIAISGSDIYVAGNFLDVGSTEGDYAVYYSGGTWKPLGTGPGLPCQSIAILDGVPYVGLDSSLARFNGTAFETWPSGFAGVSTPIVRAMAIYNNELYVGGNFVGAFGISGADYIAKFDGLNWSAVGGGLSASVNALAVYDGYLWIGGTFSDAGGIAAADRFVRWDGSVYSTPVTGPSTAVETLYVGGGNLYVGGNFTNFNTDPNADRLVVYDGSTWSALGGISAFSNGAVYALCRVENQLYIGGNFTDAATNADADKVVMYDYDTSSWTSLGATPPNNTVYALACPSVAEIYAGGAFTNLAGSGADYVAKWNGTSWSQLGSSAIGSTVNALDYFNNTLYVGGNFSSADSIATAGYLAAWNGSFWSAVGSGVNEKVKTFLASGTSLYVGGEFTGSNDKSLGFNLFGRWGPAVDAGSSVGISAVSGGDGGISLLYGSTGKYRYYNLASATWSSAVAMAPASSSEPVLTLDSSDDLFGFYANAGSIYFKTFDGSSWSPTGTKISSASAGIHNAFIAAPLNSNTHATAVWVDNTAGTIPSLKSVTVP